MAVTTSPPVTGTLTFTSTAALRIRLVRIAYRNAARGFDLAPPTLSASWAALEFTRRTFPVPRIELLRESVELYDGDFTSFFASGGPGAQGTTGTIFEILDRLRSDEGLPDDVHFLALIPGFPANHTARGHAISGRQIAEVDGPVIAQELGHDSGFPGHAPCGGPNNEDPHFPLYRTDIEASIGEFGYDVVTSAVFDPATYHDFMSYCWPQWVSPYTYGKLLTRFKAAALTQVRPVATRRGSEEAVQVAFAVNDGQMGHVRVTATRRVGTVRTAGTAVPFTVRTQDAAGAILDTVTAHVADAHRSASDPELHASAEVSLAGDARSLSILGGGDELWECELPLPPEKPHTVVVATAGDTGDAETLTVTWEGGVAGMEASVDYSSDGGVTWRTVAAGVTSRQLDLDTGPLPGGEDCRVRVGVTDGCRVCRTTSEPFAVSPKATYPAVIAPRNGLVAHRGETVQLLGDRVGPNPSGTPAGMNWSSSIDGFLGAGDELLIHSLSAGRHRITLAVDDGLGGECTDHVSICVEDDD